MASEADCLTATGDSNTTTEPPPAPKEQPLNLNSFLDPISTQQFFHRTASYASDSTSYLHTALGESTFKTRQHLLSIPAASSTIDRDIYGGGEHKTAFEKHIARLLGKQHGLFFITGVQAQLSALKIYAEKAGRPIAAWHVTSHLETAEHRSFEALYGLQRGLLGGEDGAKTLPSVQEIKRVVSLPEEQRPAVVLLEVPNRVLGCQTWTYEELEQISTACREAGVKLHCDGARLWEIEPWYRRTAGKGFEDLGALFDSVYLSFYKGLRGATGSVLVSDDEAFMEQARIWQRRAGGNAFTLAYEVVDCERGFNENIGTFEGKWEKMEEIVNGVLRETARFKTDKGLPVVSFIPERPVCCQTHTLFRGYTADEVLAARDRVVEKTNVQLFDRLWPKKTLDDKMKEDRAAAASLVAGANKEQKSLAFDDDQDDRVQEMEWMITAMTQTIETKVFVKAYIDLCEELQAGYKASSHA